MSGPRSIELRLGGPRIRDWVGAAGLTIGNREAGRFGGGIYVVGANLPAGEVTLMVTNLEAASAGAAGAAALARVADFAGDLLERADNLELTVHEWDRYR